MYKEIYKLKWQHRLIKRSTIRPIDDAHFLKIWNAKIYILVYLELLLL